MKRLKFSLMQKIIAVSIIVSVPLFALMEVTMRKVFEQQVLANSEKHLYSQVIDETDKIEEYFKSKEVIGYRSVAFIKDKIKNTPSADQIQNFDRKYTIINGAIRTNLSAFPDSDISGVFLSNISQLDDSTRKIIINTEDCFDNYAKGVTDRVFNMYLITKHQLIRIYEKSWALEIEPNHDFTKDAFYYISDPNHSPDRTAKWTPVYYDSIWKHWMTSLIVPLYVDDEFIGIIGHDTIMDDIYSNVLEKKFLASGYAFIFDSHGNIVVHPKISDKEFAGPMGQTIDERVRPNDNNACAYIARKCSAGMLADAAKKIDSDDSDVIKYTNEKGEVSFLFLRKLNFLNWYYAITVPKNDVLAMLPAFRTTFIRSALLFSTVVFCVTVMFVWLYVVSPVSKISNAVEKVSHGDFQQRIRINSNDEIGTLAASFNDMALSLSKSTTSIENLNAEIAERKKVENDLQENEEKYRLIFDKANDAIFLMDNEKFIDCNGKALEIFACTREQIINNPPSLFSPPMQPDGKSSIGKMREKITAALAGHPQIFEWAHLKANGKEFFVEVTLNVFKLKGQFHILAVVREITERKRAEEEIKNSRANLMKMIDAMPFGVVIIDKNRTIRLVNDKVVEMTGHSGRSEIVGKICHRFICPADQNNCPVMDKHQQVDQSERVLLTKDGRKIPILKSVIPITLDNEEVLLEAFIDISKSKQAEEEMKKLNENLAKSNSDLKDFVYIASHDLREPMRKISAFGNLLQNSLKGTLANDDAENLSFMIEGAGRMTKMVEGLLAYSAILTKELPPGTVKLDSLIDRLKNIELADALAKSGALIDVPKPLPVVDADNLFVRQLMYHLIFNGIKYQTKDNVPHITITSKPAAGEMVKIEITDNGIGIKPEFHQAIFTMFKRLHLRSEYDGIGIGLPICKKIVERYGGKIGVESQPGNGSTFWFTLPTADKTEPALLQKTGSEI